jgi:hypothetical protein
MKRRIKSREGDTIFINYTSKRKQKRKTELIGKFFVFLRNKRLLVGHKDGWAFYINHPRLRKKTTHTRMMLIEKVNKIFQNK